MERIYKWEGAAGYQKLYSHLDVPPDATNTWQHTTSYRWDIEAEVTKIAHEPKFRAIIPGRACEFFDAVEEAKAWAEATVRLIGEV